MNDAQTLPGASADNNKSCSFLHQPRWLPIRGTFILLPSHTKHSYSGMGDSIADASRAILSTRKAVTAYL